MAERSKAEVDHFQPPSALRVLRALREKPDPPTKAVIDLNRSDLPEPSNHLGCPSVAPEGETAERVAVGGGLPAWDRDDVDDPRRPLPSKADVRCSAVSSGFAAGRPTGTRGGSKARVDHSVVRSDRTSRIHVGYSIVMSRTTSKLLVDFSICREWFVQAFQPPRVPDSRPRRGDCGTGCCGSRLAVVGSNSRSSIHIDHSHRRLTSSIPQSPSASPPGD